MKPTFTTERLDVFLVECERPGNYAGITACLAFHKLGDDLYPYHPPLTCYLMGGDLLVVWIENTHMGGEGLALELLNGLSQRFGAECYPDTIISKEADSLFARHSAWFKNWERITGFQASANGQ